jgi:hypothetical protein
MRLLLIGLIIGLFGCSSKPDYIGKWYSFSDEGDYQELWIGEGLALSYLTKLDKVLLYEYSVSGDSLKFKLKESDLVKSHEFVLRVKEYQDEVMITEFIGGARTDKVKSYFLIDKSLPIIGSTLGENLDYRDKIFSREAAGGQSHEGHGH